MAVRSSKVAKGKQYPGAALDAYWELIGYSPTMGTVCVQRYYARDGKKEADALEGLNRIAGYYVKAWVVACNVITIMELVKCTDRSNEPSPSEIPSAPAKSLRQKVSRILSRLSWYQPPSP